MPWKRRTGTPGANRVISRCQLPSSEAGQTTRVGSLRARCRCRAIRVIVLPSPMSSARQPPRPSEVIRSSQAEAAQLIVAQRRVELPAAAAGAAASVVSRVRSAAERTDRYHFNALAVHLGAAGEHDRQGVHRCEQPQLPLARLAYESGVDHYPLVAQPHDRAVCLGQGVHLRIGEPVFAEGDLPAEGEELVRVEEGSAVGGRPRRGPHHGGGRQEADQLTRPVHGHPRCGEPGSRRAEQLVQRVLAEREYVGHRPLQQLGQRRPDPSRAAQREDRVDTRPGAEVLVALTGPEPAASMNSIGSARLCTWTTAAPARCSADPESLA